MTSVQDILIQQGALSVLGLTLGTLVCFALYAGPVRDSELTRFASLEPLNPHKLSLFGTIENIDTASRTLELETTDPYDNSDIKLSLKYDERTRLLTNQSLIGTSQAEPISEDMLKTSTYANVVVQRDAELHASTIIVYCTSVNCI